MAPRAKPTSSRRTMRWCWRGTSCCAGRRRRRSTCRCSAGWRRRRRSGARRRRKPKSGLLWDDDPRLPQVEETLWPTGGKRQGLRGRIRWARQVLVPKTDSPADTKWINEAELEECGGDAEACTKQIMDNVANLPLFNPSNLTFNALTETGRYVFEYRNIAGSDGTLEYDPKTGEIDPCPECKPTVPSSKRVCPTATP